MTILFAEDDENDAVLFSRALRESVNETGIKIDVHWVKDGTEALEYLIGGGKFGNRDSHPFPNLIVMDLKMPRQTGIDVLRWLSRHEDYGRIPKILLSGSGEEKDVEQAYRLGVNTYFQKPSGFEELKVLVHHIVCYWSHTQRPKIAARHVALGVEP